MEAWKNAFDSLTAVLKTNTATQKIYRENIKAGQIFSISHDDRALNMGRAASVALDSFQNGNFVPATAQEISDSGVSAIDPFVGISVAEHSLLDHTDQLGVFVHDSFLTALTDTAQTLGNQWTQVTGLMAGPQNYDDACGPNVAINDDGDGIVVNHQGRYFMSLNCQLTTPTADGWFECSVDPNGLALYDWPTELAQGHVGTWIPAAAADYPEIDLGFATSISAQVLAGGTVTFWMRYLTEHGGDATPVGTIDVNAVVYMQRITQ